MIGFSMFLSDGLCLVFDGHAIFNKEKTTHACPSDTISLRKDHNEPPEILLQRRQRIFWGKHYVEKAREVNIKKFPLDVDCLLKRRNLLSHIFHLLPPHPI